MTHNFWKNRNVLVTGGTGLLGSWMVEELVQNQANVVCLVRDWVPASKLIATRLVERVNIVRGELEDFHVLLRTINEYEIDSVFHLGAQTIVGTSARSALSTFEANIRGTWNLLEACKTCPTLIERIVIASSDKAYGAHETLPYSEEMPLQPRFPYDVSKACADLISLSYYHTYQLPLAITRCGNLYGGGDMNFNRLIPGTIRAALNNQSPIIRSDGRYIRDYFYVRDAVTAYLQLAERLPDEKVVGQAFNFGTETPKSVLEVVQTILHLMETNDITPTILNQTRHEIYAQYLDCSKAHRLLNWQPRFSFEEGLQETIAWYRQQLT